MDMTNTHASHNLKALVRQAKATASHVLNPLPLAGARLLGFDSESLLSGLQSRESLSEFHPFADSCYPLPQGASTDEVHQPGQTVAGGAAQPAVLDEMNNSGSEDSTVTVLNQQFIELVEQVFTALGSESAAAAGSGYAGSSNQRGKAGFSKNSRKTAEGSSKVSGTTAVHASTKSAQKDSATQQHPAAAPERESGFSTSEKSSESTGSHPVFQQLESLVTFLAADYQRFPKVDAQANPPRPFSTAMETSADGQQSHLADLTRLLIKGNEVSTGRSHATEKSRHKAQVRRLQDSPGTTQDSMQSAGKQPVAEQPSDNSGNPLQRTPELGRMPDLLRRNPNMESSETTLTDMRFHSLSPTVTQRMADALNDYLQEQAERHGVDLS